MSKKRYIALFASFVSLFVLTIYTTIYLTSINNKEVSNVRFITQKTNKTPEKNLHKQTIPHNINALEDIIEDDSDNLLTILNLWYDLDEHHENIAVRLNPRIEDAKKIGFNSRILPILKPSDKIQLPVINNKKYLLHVKNINKTGDNELEVYGEFRHNGKIYASTLSFTKKSMLALLSTPTGNFDIRMSNDKGYIYRSNQGESVVDLPSFLD